MFIYIRQEAHLQKDSPQLLLSYETKITRVENVSIRL